MSLETVFAPTERRHSQEVASATWGHLFPTAPTTVGTIIVASTMYEGVVVLDEQIDVDGSPWWHEALHNFLHDLPDQVCPHVGCVATLEIKVDVTEHIERCDEGTFEEDEREPDGQAPVKDRYATLAVSLLSHRLATLT